MVAPKFIIPFHSLLAQYMLARAQTPPERSLLAQYMLARARTPPERSLLAQYMLAHAQTPPERRECSDIRPIPRASLKLIAFWGEFSICQKNNLYCNTGNPWLLQHDDTALFMAGKLVISSQLCIQQARNFHKD